MLGTRGPPPTILVVDDEALVAMLVADTLTEAGCRAVCDRMAAPHRHTTARGRSPMPQWSICASLKAWTVGTSCAGCASCTQTCRRW